MFKRELTLLTIRDCVIGMSVASRRNLTDWHGETFGAGEVGTIMKCTYNTVHVKDPRGHVHKRRAADFVHPGDFEASERDRERSIAYMLECAGLLPHQQTNQLPEG